MAKYKKVIYVVIVLIAAIIVGYIVYLRNNNFVTKFPSEISHVYFTVTKDYNSKYGLKVYGKVDGKSCNEAPLIGVTDKTDYYVELDESGNIKKMYLVNKKYKYVNDNVTDDSMSPGLMEIMTTKSNGFKFDCNGNIISR